ncbi:response regulator [Runella slithyformis]|uniref:histidine kinase n=1 Tax=Runella slithyformis (strain ATCC 29530 / DSM 19594 / LMG 11500 / NCIMB 11436 / LSU 4) TaxID=761193 RepID=A0A7U3ZH69_RUNSL|nr:response regulator [Runella slithyformis]AEI47095.1 histidine kinase [Runella slithyformis DSM 19594]
MSAIDTTKLHRLLRKQINKYLTEECLKQEVFVNFIKVVNDSYVNFERDKELLEHSAQLNDKEYAEINTKLKEEIKQRKISVEKLIEAIHSLEIQEGIHPKAFDSNNLLGLVDFLQIQIENRKQIEAELRQAKETAEKATDAKSEFLSMMSHEIRTPLNSIVGLTYLMQQEDVSPTMAENLKILQFSTDNLYVLINDILDFSKIEAGKVELERVPFDIKQLISNIKKANQVKAEEKGNKIKLMIDDDVPEVVVGDPLRLGQIISNLVSNAVKFTANGSITVELSFIKKVENSAVIDISVIDTGIGIARDKQASIFEKFTQANSETTRQFGGTGLGLVITKKLLHLYKSDIRIESELGRGSKFFFSIELEIGTALKSKTVEANNELLNESTLKGVKVLLVEDYPVNVKVATKFLERWQIVLDVAENGQVAVDKYAAGKYDVILMDIQMPLMDGYTATAKIREMDAEIPIIALTASATLSNQDRAFLVGMNDYVTKPFNPKELFQKIAKYSHRI